MGKVKYFEVIQEGTAEGLTNAQIAKRLNKLGIGTPKRGGPWTGKQVGKYRAILRKEDPTNPFTEYLTPESPMPEYPRERNPHIQIVGVPFYDTDVRGYLHMSPPQNSGPIFSQNKNSK